MSLAHPFATEPSAQNFATLITLLRETERTTLAVMNADGVSDEHRGRAFDDYTSVLGHTIDVVRAMLSDWKPPGTGWHDTLWRAH